MKKTIVTLITLGGMAIAEEITLLPTLGSITDISDGSVDDSSWIGGMNGDGTLETLISADAIAFNIESTYGADMKETGWYGSTDNLHVGTQLGFVIASPERNGFSFTERGAYGGTFVVASVKIEDLLNGADGSVESFTLEFNADSNTLTFSAWAWNGTAATELVADSAVSTTALNSYSVDVVPKDTENLLFFFHGPGYGTTATVSNLTSSASVNLVPEPATATLSLLALAGMVARRRRK